MTKENKSTSTTASREAKAARAKIPGTSPSTSLLLTELLMPGLAGEPFSPGSFPLPAVSPCGAAGPTGAADTAEFSTSTALQAVLRERTRDIMEALSRKADYLAGHSRRVGILAALVAEDLGLPPGKVEDIQWVGSLHDAGKLAVSGEVLRKPGRLLPQEYEEIKAHPEYSEALVAPLARLLDCGSATAAVRHHHERMDGGGYPDGLVGEEIPVEARILAACDAYDALAGWRPYQDSLAESTIRKNLADAAGSHLDSEIVGIFLGHLTYYRERIYTSA
mgnify:CR=1 FL=1